MRRAAELGSRDGDSRRLPHCVDRDRPDPPPL